MRQIALYIFFIFFVNNGISQNASIQKIDQYLQDFAKKIPIPGFSIILVENNKVLFNKGYGVEKQDFKQAMTPKSSLGIGAIGRGFTAMAVMQLVEKGLLDLDAPVTKYLPWFKTANKNLSDEITLRMCLSNTAAIPPLVEAVPDLDITKSLEQFVRSMESQYIQRKPGRIHEFCDEGYSIAGLIISQVSKMPYQTYLQKHIFNPLEMTRTTSDPAQFEAIGVLEGHEMALENCIPAQRENINGNYLPAGTALHSSTEDLGHYLIALLNEGRYKNKQILRPESVQTLFKSNASFQGLGTMLGGNGIDIQYGLGWMGMTIENREIQIHTGNTGTSAAIIGINSQKNQAVAMLFNGDVNRLDRYVYPNLENTVNNVIHLMNNEPTTDFAVMRLTDPYDDDFNLERADWEKYVGDYIAYDGTNPFFKDRDIQVFIGDSDSLELKVSKENKLKGHYKLQFTSKTRAVLRNISHPREILFKIFPDGTVGGLFMFGAEFKKKNAMLENRFALEQKTNPNIRFLFPKSAKKIWDNNNFTATFPDIPDAHFNFHISKLNTQNFENFVEQKLAKQTINYKGNLKKENVKDGIWKEQSIITKENGKLQQHLLVLFQHPASEQQLELMLSIPWGQFSSDLQEVMMYFQKTVGF